MSGGFLKLGYIPVSQVMMMIMVAVVMMMMMRVVVVVVMVFLMGMVRGTRQNCVWGLPKTWIYSGFTGDLH